MRRFGVAAIVLLGMWIMADHALSGQDLNRFTRTVTVNGLSFPVLDYGEGCCCTGSRTTAFSGGTR